MNREDILREVGKFFSIEELVCSHTFAKWGIRSWQFLDTDFLRCLLVIRRDILQVPMTCNYKGATQRGLRCNRCELVREKKNVYLSSHILGKAGDFTCAGLTAEEARKRIRTMQNLLPCPIRLEDGVSWLHFDVLPQYGIDEKVYGFSE